MRLGKAPHAPCLPIAQTIPVPVDMRRPLKKCPPLQLRHLRVLYAKKPAVERMIAAAI